MHRMFPKVPRERWLRLSRISAESAANASAPFSCEEINRVRRALLTRGTNVPCPRCNSPLQSIKPIGRSETGAVVWHAWCGGCRRPLSLRVVPAERTPTPRLDGLVVSNPPRAGYATVPRWLLSGLAHAVVIYLAVVTTQAPIANSADAASDTTMVLLAPNRSESPPPPPPPSMDRSIAAPELPKGFKTVVASVNVPTALPAIDPTERFDPRDYSGVGIENGAGAFDGLAVGAAATRGGVFGLLDVDEPPEHLSSPPLRYPEMLRAAGLEGVVVVGFVVDTTGRADPESITVVASTNEGFDRSARNLIRDSRYRPARVHGRKVRVLATLRVAFNLTSALRP